MVEKIGKSALSRGRSFSRAPRFKLKVNPKTIEQLMTRKEMKEFSSRAMEFSRYKGMPQASKMRNMAKKFDKALAAKRNKKNARVSLKDVGYAMNFMAEYAEVENDKVARKVSENISKRLSAKVFPLSGKRVRTGRRM